MMRRLGLWLLYRIYYEHAFYQFDGIYPVCRLGFSIEIKGKGTLILAVD
jgi:hypothetical protein